MEQNDEILNHLVRTYGRDILHFVRFYTRNGGDAEDLTQEVFLRAYKSIGGFRADCDPKTWLLRIAVNVCRNFARWQKRHPGVPMDTVPMAQTSPSAEEQALRRWDEVALLRQVCDLPTKLKEVVLLKYFEDKSIAEIATLLGTLEGTVKVRLLRARAQMRKRQEGAANDDDTEPGRLRQLATSG